MSDEDDGPTMEELRQRLLPQHSPSKKLIVTMPQHQQRYRPSSLFERARNARPSSSSKPLGPVDVDDYIPPEQVQRFTARSHSAPRQLVRSQSGNGYTAYTTRTATEKARDVSHRWTKSTTAVLGVAASSKDGMRPTRALSGSRSTQRRNTAGREGQQHRERTLSPPPQHRTRTFSPPPSAASTRAPLVDPLSPTTRASKYGSSRGSTTKNRSGIVSINLASPSRSRKQQKDVVRSPSTSTSRESLQHPREYAAQYYAAKVKQAAAASCNVSNPDDSLADFLDQSTESAAKAQDSIDPNSFSFPMEEFTDDDRSSPDSRFIYTRRRTTNTQNKKPASERTLQSPEQVSRKIHSRRIQTRKQQQHSSPTSVLAEAQRRIFRPRDEDCHDDEDELDTFANGMMQVCSLDAIDTSSIDTPTNGHHRKHRSDEPSEDNAANERAESKYSRAIRYLATQDATILSLHEELRQTQQEVLDLKASKEHQTTAILSLQTQVATSRKELQSAQTEMARRSQAHETASAQTFREQIATEDARQQEIQKTRQAQRETELLKRQVMELEAEVNRWRPHNAKGSPPVIPTLFNPMDTSIDSVSSTSLQDKQVKTKPTTASKKQEAEESETAQPSVPVPPPTRAVPAHAVELDIASSSVTEIMANTTSRIQSSSAAAAAASAAAPSIDVQSEIAELRAALTARSSVGGASPHLLAPRKQQQQQPAREQLLNPPDVVEEDAESSLRNQLRIVRGGQPHPRSTAKPSAGDTGQATSEGALLSDMSSDLEDDDEDDENIAGAPPARRDGATMETVDLTDRETASLGGSRWHAVEDEAVKSLLKELQHIKQTVSTAQAPERPARSSGSSKERFSFSNIGIPSRNGSWRATSPDSNDESVVDSLRRRLGR